MKVDRLVQKYGVLQPVKIKRVSICDPVSRRDKVSGSAGNDLYAYVAKMYSNIIPSLH